MARLPKLRNAWTAGNIVLLAAAITTAALVHLQSSPEQTSATGDATPGQRTPQQARAINASAAASAPEQVTDPGPLPRSLAGARPDIELRTDADGNLVINPDVRVLFDFFLAGITDEPLKTVLARIQHTLAQQLDGKALEQARDLLQRYVDYRIALADLEAEEAPAMANGKVPVSALRERLQGLQALRESHFSQQESRAFFKLDQVQDDYMLRRLAIAQDDSLTESEREQALGELDQQLPAPVRRVRDRVTRHGDLYARTESMRESGASPEEIYRVRAQAFGSEAADNLTRLDRKRAEWDRRLEGYARERDAINNSGLSPEDKAAAMKALVESRFDEREQLRVRALNEHL